MKRLAALPVLLVVVLAACAGSASPAATQPRYQLYADNVSGPPITIQIGGRTIATVPCAGGAQLTAGASGVPALPWSLDVRRANGTLLRHEELTAARFSNGFLMMLLQGSDIAFGIFPGDGPAVSPGTCAKWGP